MLDLYFTILKDPKHFTQRTQPLGYGADILKNLSRKVRAIKGIEEEPKIPLFAMSPTFQLDVKAKYKFGGQGLGAYALANVHHSLGQFVDLGLNVDLGIGNTAEISTKEVSGELGFSDITEVTNHSGGAVGADSLWDEIGKQYGMNNNRHYYHGSKTPIGNVSITEIQFEEGKEKVMLANKTLSRKPDKYMDLLARNWMQVKNSDAIFAISSIKWDSRQENGTVNGGTGWAVQMAIDANKPVFVFDQIMGEWFQYQYNAGKDTGWITTNTPVLTKNFAGIGTREINNKGIKAIQDVYSNTVSMLDNEFTPFYSKSTTSLSDKYGKDGELITEWFSALIDAHVDIAADPFIYYLNVNAYTRDIVTLLLRSGVGGVNTMLFVAQPILEDIAKQLENAENEVGFKAGDVESNTIKKYKEAYVKLTGKEYTALDIKNLKEVFNPELAEKMLAKQETAGWYKYQLDVMTAFEYLNKFAGNLTQATLSSRIDTKKFGNNMSEINSYSNKLDKALSDSNDVFGIRNFDKLIGSTYLGQLTTNSIDTIKSVLSDTIIEATPAFENTVNEILKLTGKQYTASADFINKIADELYVNINTDYFYNHTELTADKVKSMVTGKNSIAKRLQDIRMGTRLTHIRQNEFLNLLTPIFEQNKPDSLRFNKPDDKWGRDGIVRAWKDLLIDENQDVQDLAKDLFYYSLVSSGFKNTINSYFDLAPRELLIDTGYNDFIKQVREYATVDADYLNYYIDEFFRNSWNNDKLVPVIEPKNIVDSFGQSEKYLITVKSNTFTGVNNLGMEVHKPYVKIGKGERSKLYKYVGTSTNIKGDTYPIYQIVEKRSYFSKGNVIRENGLGSTLAESTNKLNLSESVKHYLDNGLLEQMLSLNDSKGNPVFGRLGKVQLYEANSFISNMDERIRPIQDMSDEQLKDVMNNDIAQFMISEDGFYLLPNNKIVYLEKTSDNKTRVEKWFDKTPTKDEIDERIKNCE